jgi:hypothetical protein
MGSVGSTRVNVEGNAELPKRIADELVVLVNYLLGRNALFAGSQRDGNAVFVGAAHE